MKLSETITKQKVNLNDCNSFAIQNYVFYLQR